MLADGAFDPQTRRERETHVARGDVEAAWCGGAVVAAAPFAGRIGRHVHVPGPEVGFTYSDIGALADGLLGLLRDPVRMAELGASARRARLATEYTWAHAAQSFLDQLRAVPVARRPLPTTR